MGGTNADPNRPNFTNDYWILLNQLGQMDDLSKQWIRTQMDIKSEVPYQQIVEILVGREFTEVELNQFNRPKVVRKKVRKG